MTNLDVTDFFETLEEKIDTIGGIKNVSFDLENIWNNIVVWLSFFMFCFY